MIHKHGHTQDSGKKKKDQRALKSILQLYVAKHIYASKKVIQFEEALS